MSVEKKRLFVGGLNSGTSEQDINERFKTFGSVSSVELHKVVKKEGFPEKTFAYVDIESSETNIKRCISMLSNTKWRGGVLKIELAKESFMSRLQKEREELASQKAKPNDKEFSPLLPNKSSKQIVSAVPGTPIPGQKNWVVGKFGRALPVVHMRPKHGNKILKFDPSKTVHNLKRIKDADCGGDKSVSELTWNLEERFNKNQYLNNNKINDIGICSSSSDDDSSNEEIKISKEKSKRRNKPKKKDSTNSSEELTSLNNEENVLKRNGNSIDCNSNENLILKKKRRNEIESEKLYRKSGNEMNGEKEIFHSVELVTNGDCSTKTEKHERTNHKLQKSVKKKEKSEMESDEQEQDVIDGKESSKEKRVNKNKSKEKLIKKDLLDTDIDISREDVHTSHPENSNEKKKKRTKRKEIENLNANSSNKDEDDILNIETLTSSQAETNEVERVKTKRRDKKRKEKLNTSELPVDKDDILTMPEDQAVIHPQEETNECDSHKPRRKEKKEWNEISKVNVLEPKESVENGFMQLSNEKRNKDKTTKEGTTDGNTSFIDHMSNSNEDLFPSLCIDNVKKQIRQEDNDKTKVGSEDENVNNSCNDMKEVSTVKKNKKKKHPRDEQSDILNKSKNVPREKQTKKKILTKKLDSNAKRLQALKEREANTNIKQQLVASALQSLDKTDQQKNPKHITFDDEEEQDSNKEKEITHGDTGKISGSKAANWLGLDSDDSNNDSTFDEQIFNPKPQFEGKSGQKLFQLQKSFRGDSRFQLDKRFIESDDESEDEQLNRTGDELPDDAGVNADDDDDTVKKQLSQEKSMAMSVLRGIIGENFGSKFVDSSKRADKFKDSNLLRYDPTKDDHAQFEQQPKKDDSPEPTAKQSQQPPTEVAPSVPEVTQEKYYDVKTDALTAMFGEKKNESSTAFTFLSNQDDTDNEAPAEGEWGEVEVLKSKPWNPVMLPYDSSGDEDDSGMVEEDEQQTNKQEVSDTSFFFHFGDPELESTDYGQENPFMRTETLEQLNQHWVNVRSELTQDYKKKHKDAVRRNSKMAAKRAKMR